MTESTKEFTSTEQVKKLFQHEAGEFGVAYLLAISKSLTMRRMIEIMRNHCPELDDALGERFRQTLDMLFRRIPERYQSRADIKIALHELDLAWELGDEDIFLSTLRGLRGESGDTVSSQWCPPNLDTLEPTDIN